MIASFWNISITRDLQSLAMISVVVRHEAVLGDGASEQVLSSLSFILSVSPVSVLQTLMSVRGSLASMLTLAKT